MSKIFNPDDKPILSDRDALLFARGCRNRLKGYSSQELRLMTVEALKECNSRASTVGVHVHDMRTEESYEFIQARADTDDGLLTIDIDSLKKG